MDRPLISVLIPAYNAEKYIEHCLKSVCGQNYDNLEIIVINDGSTDRTGEIADKIAEKDDRIEVIHQENAGVATTRNRLIERSRGEYILQVDADDYISGNTVEILYNVLIKESANLAVGSYEMGYDTDYTFPEKHVEPDIRTGDQKFEKLFDDDKFDFISPCEKLYERSLFTGLSYPEGKIHEDEYLVHYIMDRADKIVYIKTPLLYYTIKRDSITHSSFSLNRLDCVPALLDRNAFFEKKGNLYLLKLCYMDFLKRFQYFYYGIIYHYPEEKDTGKKLFLYYKDVYNKASRMGMLGIQYRILFGLFLINPWLNYQARKILGKKAIDT